MENSAVPLPVFDKLVISSFLPDILRHCPLTSSDRTICFCLICLPFHQCFGSVFVRYWSASSFFIYPAWKKTRIKTLNVNKVIERKEQYFNCTVFLPKGLIFSNWFFNVFKRNFRRIHIRILIKLQEAVENGSNTNPDSKHYRYFQ